MAGLFSLLYFTTGLGGSIFRAAQEDEEGKQSYKNSVLMDSPTYTVGGSLYFTKTREICHECVNQETGARQIRSGTQYGKGRILYDFGKERERQLKEYKESYSQEQLLRAKNNGEKYYRDSDGQIEVDTGKRFRVFSNEKNDKYYLQYLTQHNGKWYLDEKQPYISISRAEWIERGCDSYDNYELLSFVLQKEEKLKNVKEIEAIKRDRLKEQEKIDNEVQGKAFILEVAIIIVCIAIIAIIP